MNVINYIQQLILINTANNTELNLNHGKLTNLSNLP